MLDYLTIETAIREIHARYADAVFRKDLDAFGDCFAEVCEWRINGKVLRGRQQVRAYMATLFPHMDRVLFNFRTPIVHVNGDDVSARTYMTESSNLPVTPVGIYYERFAKEGGAWRFKWRLFEMAYLGPPDFSAPFFSIPDYGAPPAMPPPDAVPEARSVAPKGAP